MFTRIQQIKYEKKSSLIAEQILSMIRSGELRAEEKLPSERAIAEQIGVSRPMVREAICALQIVGVIESQPGGNHYISKSAIDTALTDRVLSVLEHSESPFEILQSRKVFEVGVVRLAIEVASTEDLLSAKECWREKYEEGLKGNFEPYIEYGKDFHLAIAHAISNNMIQNIMNKLLDATIQPLWNKMRRHYIESDPARTIKYIELHQSIIEAMIRRDSNAATLLMEEHFDIVLKDVYDYGKLVNT